MKVLCYGWYNHNNLGDELFKDAFKKLFPNYIFTFVDHFNLKDVDDHDVIFFGGGSFLNQALFIPENRNLIYSKLLRKIILYIGVGLETDVHQDHSDLIQCCRLIAIRTKNNKLNTSIYKILEIPDLVYALKNNQFISDKVDPNSVLVLPNVSVVPRHNDPHWMHTSWDHFKTEMAQFLDYLVDNRYNVEFGNMCQDQKLDDNFASHAICSTMINRESNKIKNYIDIRMISTFGFIITQRYHGIVLADITNVSCLPIYHHDKLKSDNSISYYELSKNKLISSFNSIKETPKNSTYIKKNYINFNAFNQLVEEVKNILKE